MSGGCSGGAIGELAAGDGGSCAAGDCSYDCPTDNGSGTVIEVGLPGAVGEMLSRRSEEGGSEPAAEHPEGVGCETLDELAALSDGERAADHAMHQLFDREGGRVEPRADRFSASASTVPYRRHR